MRRWIWLTITLVLISAWILRGSVAPLVNGNGVPSPVSMRYPVEVGGDQETGKSTSFASSGSPQALVTTVSALYRVNCYIEVTSAGSGGTVSVTFGWTDDGQAETLTSSTLSLTSVGWQDCGSPVTFKGTAGNTLGYWTTVSGASGSPLYSVFVIVEEF